MSFHELYHAVAHPSGSNFISRSPFIGFCPHFIFHSSMYLDVKFIDNIQYLGITLDNKGGTP